tara:strand:- start:249 stop:2000 length:1752 start_codon:yes stop_codon:yes gene_type:complete
MDILKKDEDEAAALAARLGISTDTASDEDFVPYHSDENALDKTYNSLANNIDKTWLRVMIWFHDDPLEVKDSWIKDLNEASEQAEIISKKTGVATPFTTRIIYGGPRKIEEEGKNGPVQRYIPTEEEWANVGGKKSMARQVKNTFQKVVREYDEDVAEAIKKLEPKDEILSDAEMARRQARGRKAKEGRPDGKLFDMNIADDAEPLSSEKAPVSVRSQLLGEERIDKPDGGFEIVTKPYTIIRRFFHRVNSMLLGGGPSVPIVVSLPSKVEEITDGTGKREIAQRKEQKEAREKQARKVEIALENFASGNLRQAGENIRGIKVENLVTIQKLLTRGKPTRIENMDKVFLENPKDAKWDHETKQWVDKQTGESALRMYGDRNSFVLFRSLLLKNKRNLMPSRKSQGQILQIMEDFKNPEFDLSALDNPQRRIGPVEAPNVDARGFPVGYPQRKDRKRGERSEVKTKFTMTELLDEVTEWMQGEDKTIPLHPSLAKSYRKLLIRLVEKLRTDSLKGKTENLSEDLEVIEFLYGVLTHMGRSRTINDVMLSRVEEVAEKEGKEIDWYRDFNLPPMLGDEQPSGEEE